MEQSDPLMERVYIETTFVSYLTARPSRDLIIAGHQQITHDWWDHCRGDYELCGYDKGDIQDFWEENK